MLIWTLRPARLATLGVPLLRGEIGFVGDLCVGSAFLFQHASRMVFSQSNSTSDFSQKKVCTARKVFKKIKKLVRTVCAVFLVPSVVPLRGGRTLAFERGANFMSDSVRKVDFVLQKYNESQVWPGSATRRPHGDLSGLSWSHLGSPGPRWDQMRPGEPR